MGGTLSGASYWNAERAAEIIHEHLGLEGPMLPILHALQEEFGYVNGDAVPMIAKALNLSRAEVHGVTSFYHDFRHEPAGRHVLKLCRGESCQSMGSEELARKFLTGLGIEWGGTTADGDLTVEAIYCLGLCACSPAAMLDDELIGALDEETLAEAVNTVSA
ncbi:NADH dehydrogenase (ubiquinone) 24 kDa subunit [Methylocella silvestris BL2]|uniref:NADH dehydrogenase (Ubiquinone) 24 kDa subunit n=1 Tax=Methylocella silvestris (strain DSM 15510 / CIP 108128 / LMG 27833 / NCIMB 13906 / BL2) TaxID=395965 RepID=B8EJ47_METSB|nr:formate dehydrogenase subunit gamma [Methylocella silvestris]ACK52539.1 NADH dehydrogenase (ubiquinone) 24 kDa subunit [Methylocella silvestris BL2]